MFLERNYDYVMGRAGIELIRVPEQFREAIQTITHTEGRYDVRGNFLWSAHNFAVYSEWPPKNASDGMNPFAQDYFKMAVEFLIDQIST